jgi:hypothetical protein
LFVAFFDGKPVSVFPKNGPDRHNNFAKTRLSGVCRLTQKKRLDHIVGRALAGE